MSPSATSATQTRRNKGQLTAVIYRITIPFACKSCRYGCLSVFQMPTSKITYLMRGPFPVSLESHPIHFSVYSKFRGFVLTECPEGEEKQKRKLDYLSFPIISRKSFITFKSLSPMQKSTQLSKRQEVLKSAG